MPHDPENGGGMSESEKLNSTYMSVKRLESAMMGDPAMGSIGFVQRVDGYGKAIEALSDRTGKLEKDRMANRLMSLSGLGSAVHHVALTLFGK